MVATSCTTGEFQSATASMPEYDRLRELQEFHDSKLGVKELVDSRIKQTPRILVYDFKNLEESHVKETWDEIRALQPPTIDQDELDKRENENLVMSLLSGLGYEFSELGYNILRSKGMPLYDKMICMVEKEISARKLYDAPKVKRVDLVEEMKENVLVAQNGSIDHANKSTQGKRAPQSAKNVTKLVILTNGIKIVNIVTSKGIQKTNIDNCTLTSSLWIS
ncbi:hypothetical protein ACH5RR_033055 [Cinchona calisaya]|uniref:Uncharacterized protein n=1 Tax=Cinchona calisaya TaxID=153742 RepID=A0ABD2YJW6_9GENT